MNFNIENNMEKMKERDNISVLSHYISYYASNNIKQYRNNVISSYTFYHLTINVLQFIDECNNLHPYVCTINDIKEYFKELLKVKKINIDANALINDILFDCLEGGGSIENKTIKNDLTNETHIVKFLKTKTIDDKISYTLIKKACDLLYSTREYLKYSKYEISKIQAIEYISKGKPEDAIEFARDMKTRSIKESNYANDFYLEIVNQTKKVDHKMAEKCEIEISKVKDDENSLKDLLNKLNIYKENSENKNYSEENRQSIIILEKLIIETIQLRMKISEQWNKNRKKVKEIISDDTLFFENQSSINFKEDIYNVLNDPNKSFYIDDIMCSFFGLSTVKILDYSLFSQFDNTKDKVEINNEINNEEDNLEKIKQEEELKLKEKQYFEKLNQIFYEIMIVLLSVKKIDLNTLLVNYLETNSIDAEMLKIIISDLFKEEIYFSNILTNSENKYIPEMIFKNFEDLHSLENKKIKSHSISKEDKLPIKFNIECKNNEFLKMTNIMIELI